MKATRKLHDLGQSLWLDNITRDLLDSGTLKRYIEELSITGLTSTPTIFDLAIKNSADYDGAIGRKVKEGKSGEALFFDLAIEDLRRAADLFRPVYDRTNGVDGWVSLEVSPLLARNTAETLAAAKALHKRADRPNLFIKIPGTRERRIEAGLNPDVGSVAWIFVSRWDVAVASKAPDALRNRLGIAIAGQTYEKYRALLDSPRWQRIANSGARAQRLLWASTGTKDPNASAVLYVQALALPFTINTMPEATLKALSTHDELSASSSASAAEVLAEFAKAGIDSGAVAAQLLEEGVQSFAKSWNNLLACIASKSETLTAA